MLRHLPAEFADGGFDRRTFLSSCSAYIIRQLANKGIRHYKSYATQRQASNSQLSLLEVFARSLQVHADQCPCLEPLLTTY